MGWLSRILRSSPGFKTTKIPLNASTWDKKSCPECGRLDLILQKSDSSSWKSKATETRTATVRNSDGDETGSIEYEVDVSATSYADRKEYVCGFCLYAFRHESSGTH